MYIVLSFKITSMILIVSDCVAQRSSEKREPSLMVNAGVIDFFYREKANEKNDLEYDVSAVNVFLGCGYINGISKRSELQISTGIGHIKSKTDMTKYTDKLLVETGALLHFNLYDNYKRVNPFAATGLKFDFYSNNINLLLPIQAGLQVSLYKSCFLQVSLEYLQPLLGGMTGHFQYSIGIAGNILPVKKRNKKSSGDPGNEYQHQKIIDSTILSDVDGDGIKDLYDKCPLVPGFIQYEGCPAPDKDQDGINDEEDGCPDVYGVRRYSGCPIPDTDKDGLHDEEDACPLIAGLKENKGCPLSREQLQAQVDQYSEMIFFETDKADLKEGSMDGLKKILMLLMQHPSYSVLIEGHTDSTGTASHNKILSTRRAEAILRYLTDNGYPADKVVAHGYGDAVPLGDNKTVDGKRLNRRVKIRIVAR